MNLTIRIMEKAWNLRSFSVRTITYSTMKFHTTLGYSNKTEGTNKSSTVDPADIKQHSKLTKEWWDPAGSMKALHSFNLIRVPFIRDGLVDDPSVKKITPLEGMKILDVGCGGGILSEPLARLGAKVTGIDASSELIEMAKEHSALNPAICDNLPSYICTTVEDHAASNKDHYDAVVASEVIEHVNNKELFIKSCVDALKPGGRIFFTTPNRNNVSHFTVIFLAECIFKVVPRGTHQIEKFVTPNELTFMLDRNNCHVEIIHGLFYNILANRWMWMNLETIMFALQAVKHQ